MRRLALALVLAAIAAPSARALELPPLCVALHGLGDAARASGQAQRISVGGSGGGLDCRPGATATDVRAFCDAAAAAVGGAGADMFAWRLHACVDNLAAETQKVTAPGDVGPTHRKRLTRLAASLGRGLRFDLSAVGERYDLVVWQTK